MPTSIVPIGGSPAARTRRVVAMARTSVAVTVPAPCARRLRVGGEAHGQPRVEVVGRRRAVGAEGDGDAGGEQVREAGEAAGQLLVRRRAVAHRRPGGRRSARCRASSRWTPWARTVPGPSSPVSCSTSIGVRPWRLADRGQLGRGLAGVHVDAGAVRRGQLGDGRAAGARRAGTCCAGRPSAVRPASPPAGRPPTSGGRRTAVGRARRTRRRPAHHAGRSRRRRRPHSPLRGRSTCRGPW